MQEHILRLGFDPKYADMVGQAERIFNLGIYQQKHMGSWISPNQRVILMGDACHASTPFLYAGFSINRVALASSTRYIYGASGTVQCV
jgi:2-polyprenyl-6-methoxyphenol hydroxylase-like FAD-dependent oxidoreductase